MSTQTEPLVETLSTSMLNMLAHKGPEERQEHIVVQREMGQTVQDAVKTPE